MDLLSSPQGSYSSLFRKESDLRAEYFSNILGLPTTIKEACPELKTLHVTVKVFEDSPARISEVSFLLRNGEFILHFVDPLERKSYGKVDHPYLCPENFEISSDLKEIWKIFFEAQEPVEETERKVRTLLALVDQAFSRMKVEKETLRQTIKNLLINLSEN